MRRHLQTIFSRHPQDLRNGICKVVRCIMKEHSVDIGAEPFQRIRNLEERRRIWLLSVGMAL